MNKKILALVLQGAMVASIFAGCTPKTTTAANGAKPGDTTPGATTAGKVDPEGKVVIGTGTEPTGDFATPYWQNNATDNEINGMMNGYGTVASDFNGAIMIDPTVVKEQKSVANPDGSKTFTFTINENLTFDDGSKITAKNYVASALLWSSKVIKELKGKPTYGNQWVGYDDFLSGKTKEFSGVRLLGDYQFSIQLAKEFVPSFYELASVGTGPLAIDFWLNNATAGKVEVKDDGKGAYFSDNFTTANFKDSINNARKATTRPSSGPYKLKEWNPTTLAVTLEKNDKYLGDHTGQKPQIKTLVYKKVTPETQLDEFKTGQVDMLNGLIAGDEINAGLALVEQDATKYAVATYPRSGYGKIQFACDFGPTQFVEVRQAIAHLLDRNDFNKAFTSGYGIVVNGPYGESMWMYKESKKDLDAKLNQYAFSKDKAIELLTKAGFTLDKDGKPYAGTGLRYRKMEDGTMMPLQIQWASSEKNPVSELLVTKLQKSKDVTAAGMEIVQTQMTFNELLSYLSRDGSQDAKYQDKKFHMFNLASNFGVGYVPMDTYTTNPEKLAQGYNTNFIVDKDLEKLAEGYWKVDAKDKEKFRQGFVDFVVKWNQLLPDIPLYSNIYHDFMNAKIKNYNKTTFVSTGYALLYAYVEGK